MFDVIFCISTSIYIIWGKRVFFQMSGLPFLYAALIFASLTDIMPDSIKKNENLSFATLWTVVMMTILTDLLQCTIHVCTHAKLLGSIVYNSHLVHHEAKTPNIETAFRTGVIDAFIQLIVPLYLTILCVNPDRITCILFGMFYSNWLIHLHTNTSFYTPLKHILLTPQHHARHHSRPNTEFAHVMTCVNEFGDELYRCLNRMSLANHQN